MNSKITLLIPSLVCAGIVSPTEADAQTEEEYDEVSILEREFEPEPNVFRLESDEDSAPTNNKVGHKNASDDPNRYATLTDKDFEVVAKQLGVEIAAIKAVVRVEAGDAMEGFWAPGVPVVNFDPTMYAQYKKLASKGGKNVKVPSGLKGYALKEWTQLTNARKVNWEGANMGTFWGMFQIGGFNYKKCECSSVDEFIKKMSESEFEQLELFAIFIRNSGMLNDLRNKEWSSFSRKYNGPSYKKRGYHTKMANYYKKFSGK